MKPEIRRILVPVDFSAPAVRAIEYAAVLAAELGATVHLLHVLEESFVSHGPWESHPGELAERRELTVQDLSARLQVVASGFKGAKVTTEVRSGRAAREIVAVATSRGTDLIVMGTHGRTGLGRLLMGSIAEEVVRKAPCPVLTVKEPLVLADEPVAAAEEVSRR